jgi:hypothetical protein
MQQRCEECGSRMSDLERGWRVVHAGDPDDDEVVLAYYCPVCARRELDDRIHEHALAPIAGSAPGRGSSRMDYVIEFDRDGVDVVVTTGGVANANGFLRLNRALVADSRFRPGMNILVDHTALDTRQYTETDLREAAASLKALRARIGASRIAFVVSDERTADQVDRVRMEVQPMEVEFRQFYSRAHAIAWLHPSALIERPS